MKLVNIYGQSGKTDASTWTRYADLEINGNNYTIRVSVSDTKANPNACDPDCLYSQSAADSYYRRMIPNNNLIKNLILANKSSFIGGNNFNASSGVGAYPEAHIVFAT